GSASDVRAARDVRAPRVPSRLRAARTCYDHVAGALGVALHDGMLAAGWIGGDDAYDVTPAGRAQLAALGVDVDVARKRRRRFAVVDLVVEQEPEESHHRVVGHLLRAGEELHRSVERAFAGVLHRRRELVRVVLELRDRGVPRLGHGGPAAAERLAFTYGAQPERLLDDERADERARGAGLLGRLELGLVGGKRAQHAQRRGDFGAERARVVSGG